MRLSPESPDWNWSHLARFRICLADRFAFYAGVAIILSLVMLATLSYFNFARSLDDIYRSRINVTANELRLGIEKNLSFGLALEEVPGLQELLNFIAKVNPDLLGLGVFKQGDNRLLFSAGKSPTSEPAFFAEPPSKSGILYVADSTSVWISLPLHNSFGQVVGYLVVGLPTLPLNTIFAEVRKQMLTYLIIFIFVMLPLLFIGNRAIFNPLLKRLEAITSGEPLDLDRSLEIKTRGFFVAKAEAAAALDSMRNRNGEDS